MIICRCAFKDLLQKVPDQKHPEFETLPSIASHLRAPPSLNMFMSAKGNKTSRNAKARLRRSGSLPRVCLNQSFGGAVILRTSPQLEHC